LHTLFSTLDEHNIVQSYLSVLADMATYILNFIKLN